MAQRLIIAVLDTAFDYCLDSKFGCGDGPTTLPAPIMPQQNVMNNLSSTSTPASGGKGSGSTCVGNCTTGTSPPVDCKINPNDPSCTQTLQPLTPPPATQGHIAAPAIPNGSDSNG